jgi:hypothetical protein
MRCDRLAFLCFLLPCGVIAACFLLSTHLEQIPICFPFFTGCTSISAAARQDPAIHLFRMTMLPLTTVLAGFWLVTRVWLLRLDPKMKSVNTLTILGVTGAVFLILYVVFLGTDGAFYGWLRRFGTTTYFGGTGLAQLFLAARLYEFNRRAESPPFSNRLLTLFLWICVSMLIMGIVYIPAAHAFRAFNVENIIEWNFAFLLHINFALVSLLWTRQHLTLTLLTPRIPHETSR